ncbi:ArgE/DapE family deacylase [Ferrovibrio terrae]|uniref:Probable succinyl-diaminopimelate desuccinylase n=1 Tax=Ferrovibrio terrae TaxID=2594003 RepID=A0A516H137_9PROT|nr:ArgE/DapE family deacylase [Ferrovibrio terrae]
MTIDKAVATAIHDFVTAEQRNMAGMLAELVKVPSDNPPGDCAPHAKRATALLEQLGFTVEQHPVPADLVQANGMITCTNLIVRKKFGEGPVVAMNAHGDVVPPGEGWSVDPFAAAVKDGVMYGRGVAVSKSDFVTYAYALLALQKLGKPIRGTIELHLTYDEEVGGGIGPEWILKTGLSKPDYAFSAGFSYAVTTAHNGCLHLEVIVNGLSAHAARPDTGHDALEAANKVLTALYAYRDTLSGTRSKVEGITTPSLVVGLIKGGINTNVVPDRVSLRLDRRMIPEENPEQVEAGLRDLIAKTVQGLPGISVQINRVLLARPFGDVPGVEKLIDMLTRHATEVMGKPVGTEGIPLYTDARHYSAAGVKTVLYGAGPRNLLEANGHRADEKLVLSDLYKATEVVARTLYELLS